jgi:hypothetical protein
MSWKEVDVMDQRTEFVLRVMRNVERFGDVCREFGISRNPPQVQCTTEEVQESQNPKIWSLIISVPSVSLCSKLLRDCPLPCLPHFRASRSALS